MYGHESVRIQSETRKKPLHHASRGPPPLASKRRHYIHYPSRGPSGLRPAFTGITADRPSPCKQEEELYSLPLAWSLRPSSCFRRHYGGQALPLQARGGALITISAPLLPRYLRKFFERIRFFQATLESECGRIVHNRSGFLAGGYKYARLRIKRPDLFSCDLPTPSPGNI